MNSNSKPKFFDNMFSVFLDKLNMSSIFWPCGHNKKKNYVETRDGNYQARASRTTFRTNYIRKTNIIKMLIIENLQWFICYH